MIEAISRTSNRFLLLAGLDFRVAYRLTLPEIIFTNFQWNVRKFAKGI